MMSLTAATATMRKLAVEAREVLEDETMTAAEKAAKYDQMKAVKLEAEQVIAVADQAKAFMLGGSSDDMDPDTGAPQGAASAMDQMFGSKGWQRAVERAKTHSKGTDTVAIDAYSFKGFSTKANTITEGGQPAGYGLNGSAGALVTPQFLPGIVDLLFQPAAVADLIPQTAVSSPLVSYPVQSAFVDGSLWTPEEGLKGQSDFGFDRRTDQAGKITAFAKTSDETIDDVPFMQGFMESQLVASIYRKEDAALLNGDGKNTSIVGLLNRPGLHDPITVTGATGQAYIDAFLDMQTALESESFVVPNAFVVNPKTWNLIRKTKDANGQYFGGGPFTGAYGNGAYSPNSVSLFGLPGIKTTYMPEGQILLGNFQNAQIGRLRGITIEMTNSDQDDFIHDRVTVRAEERLLLAVFRPAGFGVIKLGS